MRNSVGIWSGVFAQFHPSATCLSASGLCSYKTEAVASAGRAGPQHHSGAEVSALNAGTKNVNLCHLENQTNPGTNKEGLASHWYELQNTLWAKISI